MKLETILILFKEIPKCHSVKSCDNGLVMCKLWMNSPKTEKEDFRKERQKLQCTPGHNTPKNVGQRMSTCDCY